MRTDFMKITPYIYILFLFGMHPVVFSQKIIFKTHSDSDRFICEQLQKEVFHANDSARKNLVLFQNKARQLGFIDLQIDSIHKRENTWDVFVSLHDKIDSIVITYKELPPAGLDYTYINQPEKQTFSLPFERVGDFIQRITDYYASHAYPFAEVQLTGFRKEKKRLRAMLQIDKKKRRRFDKIIVKGYTGFPKSYLKYRLSLTEDAFFNKSQIVESSVLLKSIPFVSEIKKPEVLFTKDSTFLYLYLKKETQNSIDGLLGFSVSETKKRVQVFGNFNIHVQNAFNKGEKLDLEWLGGENKKQDLDLSYEQAYILHTPFSAAYRLQLYKQDSLYANIKHHIQSTYQITRNQHLGFIFSQSKSKGLSLMEQVDIQDYSNYFYGLSYLYKKGENSFSERAVHYETQVLQGKRNGEKQYKLRQVISYRYPLGASQNFFFKNVTGIFISKKYLENESYLLGGSKNIRGFDEKSLPAKHYNYSNLSYNYAINGNSYLSGLIDLGALAPITESKVLYVYSFGVGFSQRIKTGRLHIRYFIGNTHKQAFTLSNGKLHLSFTQNF